MLPSLFPDETINSLNEPAGSLDEAGQSESTHSYRILSSGLWMLGGVFAAVFGGLLVLIWGIYAITSSEPSTTASTKSNELGMSGQVYGSWTDQPLSGQDALGVFDAQQLSDSLHRTMKEFPESEFGIVVAPVGNGAQVRINDTHVALAASTTKILTAAAVLSGVDDGSYRLDQIVYQVAPEADKDGSDKDKEASSPTPSPTVEQKQISLQAALELMVNQSDNQAWEHLIGFVGSKNLQKYADGLGMEKYDVRENKVSASDLALLLHKLYSRQLLSESSTKLLLSWMQDTNEESMIPAGMDEVGEVYHKYGWLGSSLHDIAIVENHSQPVVVVILSQGSQNYNDGKAAVRKLAEVVEVSLLAGREE